MNTTFNEANIGGILDNLKAANEVISEYRQGENGNRQPVHTVYGGAHLFKSDTGTRIGELAMKNFKQYAPEWSVLKKALGMTCSDEIAQVVYKRVEEKLFKEALEDFRIDFEDGFGNRSDEEEDETAARAAKEVAKGGKQEKRNQDTRYLFDDSCEGSRWKITIGLCRDTSKSNKSSSD
jgi:hypothetical protein